MASWNPFKNWYYRYKADQKTLRLIDLGGADYTKLSGYKRYMRRRRRNWRG